MSVDPEARRRSLRAVLTALLLSLAACDMPAPVDPSVSNNARPSLARSHPTGVDAKIPDQYIVVFNSDVRDVPGLAEGLTRSQGGVRLHTYQHAIKGFAARLSPQAAEALARNPNVASVEQDVVTYAVETTVQNSAPWGLDRVDQRDRPLTNAYEYEATGSGVNVYIVDTGIRFSHNEFGGRAALGVDVMSDAATQQGNDCNGHGTHVAGTVGGATYGVAKNVNLFAVRVLGCAGYGSSSGVIAGIDWLTAQKLAAPATPMIANMSLGGDYVAAEVKAVQRSIAAGVSYVVAAGNDDTDACTVTPAATPEALTVGATTPDDERAYFSNVGRCLDLFAPGTGIMSAGVVSDASTAIFDGTSMAAPHVAGVAALYLENNRSASPAAVTGAIVSSSSIGRVGNLPNGSPNLLLFSRLVASPPTPLLTLPVKSVAFTFERENESIVTPTISSNSITLSNGGTGAMTWTTSSQQAWLSGTPGGVTAAGATSSVDITVNASTLPLGVHTGTIVISGENIPNAPQSVTITVSIVPAARFSLSKKALGFTMWRESESLIFPATATATFDVTSVGLIGVDWKGTADQPWLAITPAAGTLAATGASATVDVAIDATALPVGTHSGTIVVENLTAADPLALSVTAKVLPVRRFYIGSPLTDVGGDWQSTHYFRVEVPEDAPDFLLIRTSGGVGATNLAVAYGAMPGASTCFVPLSGGTAKSCFIANPEPGSYWVTIGFYGTRGNYGITLEALTPAATSTELVVEPQVAQFSDLVRLTASVLPANASGNVQFQRSINGGVTFANLGSPVPLTNGTAALSPQITQTAGTALQFRAVFLTNGEFATSTSAPQAVTVTREDATLLYDESNPVALRVSSSGGMLNTGALSLILRVKDTEPDQASFPGSAAAGNIVQAGLSVTLEPAGAGSTVTLTCVASPVTGSGYAALRSFTCTNPAAIPVNAYEVVANVTGTAYAGRYSDVLTVSDPSLGFATGGGTFVVDAERVNFGFTMKYTNKGTNLQGNFVALRHHADGTVSRMKSNALSALALGQNQSLPMGWASFDGRANWTRWDATIGDYVITGNQSFVVYVEDRNNPGSGVDRIWLRGPGQLSMSGTLSTASSNAAVLTGGDISAPHATAKK